MPGIKYVLSRITNYQRVSIALRSNSGWLYKSTVKLCKCNHYEF